jgi:tetratricopeptide (TPR) repeat protein
MRLGLDGLIQKSGAFKKDAVCVSEKMKAESKRLADTGNNLYVRGKTSLSEDYFKKAIDIDPGNEGAYLHLGHLYEFTRQYDKSLIIFEKLIDINPYTEFRNSIYSFLFIMYQDPSLSVHARNKIADLIKKMPSDSAFKNPGMPFILNKKLIMRSLESNLVKIIDLIKLNKAVPIVQTYYDNLPLFLNNLLRNFTKERNLLLVDNAKSLAGLSDINSYFAPNDHPSDKGYLLIAQNLYQALKKINK